MKECDKQKEQNPKAAFKNLELKLATYFLTISLIIFRRTKRKETENTTEIEANKMKRNRQKKEGKKGKIRL